MDIAESNLNLPQLNEWSSRMQYKLDELLCLFGATALWCENGLLACFVALINNPDQCATLFLPTMPASNYFEIRDILAQDRWWYGLPAKLFYCPNGHPYFIGECNLGNEGGICPDCHQPIGGREFHVLHEGNREAGEITEESQAGYKLTLASLQDETTPERNLNKISVAVIRFFLHAAMLLGARNGDAIQK